MSRLRLLISTGAILAFATTTLFAQERPLIWEFSKDSDTAYKARLGSRLPTSHKSSIGADMQMRGPDLESFGNPLSVWVSTQLAERSTDTDIHALDVNARLEGRNGNGNLSVRNRLVKNWALVEAEVNHEISIEFRPSEERRRYVRQTQDVILKAPATGTEMRLHAARTDNENWHTSLGVTQKVRESITLSATIEEPVSNDPKSRFGARYHYQW